MATICLSSWVKMLSHPGAGKEGLCKMQIQIQWVREWTWDSYISDKLLGDTVLGLWTTLWVSSKSVVWAISDLPYTHHRWPNHSRVRPWGCSGWPVSLRSLEPNLNSGFFPQNLIPLIILSYSIISTSILPVSQTRNLNINPSPLSCPNTLVDPVSWIFLTISCFLLSLPLPSRGGGGASQFTSLSL